MKKILTCNPSIVDKLIECGQLPEQYLSENYKEIYIKFKQQFPVGKFFYDRSGTIPHYLNVDATKSPIPISTNFNLSFSEVVEKRAKELLAIGKPINVSWSGGLDSTFILFTLHHYANDKSQIKVYGTYNSILESGNIFDKYIKNIFKYDIHTNTSYENNYKNIGDEIIVSGSPGNDIFYKPIGTVDQPPLNRYDAWMVFKDPSHGIYHYADSPYEQVLADCNLEFLEDFIKKSPRKIETLQDLRWWVCFCFNWYTTLNNSSIGVGVDTVNKMHHFYNTDEFQLWSIYNKDPTTKVGDYSDDRWHLREKIAEYTGDTFYSTKKADFISVLSKFDHKWLFLLNDYSNIYLNQ